MRQVTLPDLHHAAIAICAVAYPLRGQLCAELLWRAHVADKMVKRLRKLHPLWGDGSLRSAAIAYYCSDERQYTPADYPCAMMAVLKALQQRCDQHT